MDLLKYLEFPLTPQLYQIAGVKLYGTIVPPMESALFNHAEGTIREAAAEGSSSWSLGEYAVSIRSDLRSPASL